MIRKLHIVLIALSLLPMFGSTVNANESRLPVAPIYIDGVPIQTKYLMREGHLLVPAIYFKHTGAYVNWNSQYRSAVFKMKDVMFACPVGKSYTDDFVGGGTWKRGTLTTSTVDLLGEPFVPLVDVAKKLGMTVKYNPQENRTYVTTNFMIKTNMVQSANTSEKLVALTFDDGPENYYTPRILDILKEKRAPATFFVVGRQIRYYPEIMKRIVAEGHAIANHTDTHPDLRYAWSDKVKEEIRNTQEEMQRVVGKKPDVFRPPYGAYTKADIVMFNEIGLRNILWSVDTLDWSGTTKEDIMTILHRDISPGAIVLQHNFQSNTRLLDGTVQALPDMIDEMRAKGYKFVTIQTLLEHQRRLEEAPEPPVEQPKQPESAPEPSPPGEPAEPSPGEDAPTEPSPEVPSEPAEPSPEKGLPGEPTEPAPEEGTPTLGHNSDKDLRLTLEEIKSYNRDPDSGASVGFEKKD